MPNNPHVSRTFATLRIWGTHLDPDVVTKSLGITPTELHKAGDPRGRRNTWPHGHWALISKNQVHSTDLSEHIDWLLNQVEVAQSQFAELRKGDVHADIFCFLEVLTGHGGPSFEPLLLRRVAALDLELGVDIYVSSAALDVNNQPP